MQSSHTDRSAEWLYYSDIPQYSALELSDGQSDDECQYYNTDKVRDHTDKVGLETKMFSPRE